MRSPISDSIIGGILSGTLQKCQHGLRDVNPSHKHTQHNVTITNINHFFWAEMLQTLTKSNIYIWSIKQQTWTVQHSLMGNLGCSCSFHHILFQRGLCVCVWLTVQRGAHSAPSRLQIVDKYINSVPFYWASASGLLSNINLKRK